MIYGDLLCLLHWCWCIKVEGLPCFKMAALLTHLFQWTAVAKGRSSVYVYGIYLGHPGIPCLTPPVVLALIQTGYNRSTLYLILQK